jgi:23S rRNA (uracil1939-C5)-methyltransferase
MGPTTVHMAGEQRQTVRWGAMELAVGPTAFLQTRHDMAQHMVTTAASLLPQHMTRLVDLYAGVGLFGLALRDRADAVTLVERDVAGIEDARWNIERLQAGHVTAVQADVLDFAPQLAELQPDAVVLDPPRAGCAPAVADAVAALPGEPVLVYVSCHPPALARDVKRLQEGGFRVTDVVPLDMFPHTAHVEVMVRLARA